MGLIAMVGPNHPLQSTCVAALRVLGHRVTCLDPGSVFEAMAWVGQQLPDALLLDLDLEGPCHGESLARAFHEDPEMTTLPRVGFTRRQAFEGLERFERYGLRSLLRDPQGSDAVVEAVRLALKTSRPCVAVVDASHQARAGMGETLEAAGCLPLELEPISVFGLLRALRRIRPDALVSADHLPTCAIMSLVRAVREDSELKGLPILISAVRPEESARELARFGGLKCLPKPVAVAAVRAWMEGTLVRP